MNRIKKIVFIAITTLIIICINGCSNEKSLGDNYIQGQDSQYMFMQTDDDRYIVKGNNGYYFANGNYLYYADSKSMKPIILCNKPNCLHDKETDPYKKADCNAFIGNDFNRKLFTFYDNNIYFYENDIKNNGHGEIIRLSLDGTQRKTICKIDGTINSMALHRGKLYYSTCEKTVKNGNEDNGEIKTQFIEYNFLNSSAEPNVLKEYIGINAGIQSIIPIGNRVYFTEFGFQKATGEFDSYEEIYNLNDKTFSKLGSDVNKISISDFAFFKGKPIYSPVIGSGKNQTIDPYLYSCDINGKNTKKMFNYDNNQAFFADSKYIYLDNAPLVDDNKSIKRVLTVLDQKGHTVDTIDINEISTHFSFSGADDNYLFIKYEDNKKGYIKYIDKKELGSGNVKLHDFFEIDKKYMDSTLQYKN
jgi:hypothetical protein